MRFRLMGTGRRQPGRFLGRRVLREGDKGEDVRALQTRLAELGYAVGPVDGFYGFLTEEAVRQLQKDFRLRIDGIAGRQVYGVVKENIPQTRRVSVVKPQDTLMSLAGRYGVSELAIRNANHLRGSRGPYPGRWLVTHRREVAAFLDKEAGQTEAFAAIGQHFRELSFISATWFQVDAQGGLQGETVIPLANLAKAYRLPLYAGVRLGPWPGLNQAQLKNLLWSRRNRRKVVEAIDLLSRRRVFAGINLVLEGILPRDRRFVARLAFKMARRLEARQTPLLITVPATTGARGERDRASPYDRRLLGRLANRLILMAGSPEDPVWWERAVSFAIEQVPCWKIVLGGPAGGEVSLPWDRLLSMANRYNLAGIAIDGLGRDGQGPWRSIPHFFEVAR